MSERTGRTVYVYVDRDIFDGRLSDVVAALSLLRDEHEAVDPQARLEVDWDDREARIIRAETKADEVARKAQEEKDRLRYQENTERMEREQLARLKAKYEAANVGSGLAAKTGGS